MSWEFVVCLPFRVVGDHVFGVVCCVVGGEHEEPVFPFNNTVLARGGAICGVSISGLLGYTGVLLDQLVLINWRLDQGTVFLSSQDSGVCYGRGSPPPRNVVNPEIGCLSELIHHEFGRIVTRRNLFSNRRSVLFTVISGRNIASDRLSSVTNISTTAVDISIGQVRGTNFVVGGTSRGSTEVDHLCPARGTQTLPRGVECGVGTLRRALYTNVDKGSILQFSSCLRLTVGGLYRRDKRYLTNNSGVRKSRGG